MSKGILSKAKSADPDVYVVLRVSDVMALRPQWDEAGAAHFLQFCANHLAHRMLDAGTTELARLLRVGEELAAVEGASNA